MTASTSCDRCGKSLVGEAVNLSLGLDEPKVLSKCTCGGFEGLLRDLQLLQPHVQQYKFDDRQRSGRDSTTRLCAKGEIASGGLIWKTEIEIRISNRHMVNRVTCLFSKSTEEKYIEKSAPVVCSMQGKHFNAKLRCRTPSSLCSAPVSNTLKVQMQRVELCPGVTVHRSIESVYPLTRHDKTPVAWTSVDKCATRTLRKGDWNMRIREWMCGKSIDFEAEYLGRYRSANGMAIHCIDILRYLLTYTNMYSDCLNRMLPFDLSQLALRTPKVIDIRGLEDDAGFVYTCKADGQPTWVVIHGCLSITISCKEPLKLHTFRILEPLEMDLSGTVMLCELLPSGQRVYLDGVCYANELVSISHNYTQNLSRFARAIQIAGIVVRQYYPTLEEACNYRVKGDMPSDGIILIHDASSKCYRIKEPTIDLRVVGNELVSGGPYRLTWHIPESLQLLRRGCVYEFRASGEFEVISDVALDVSNVTLDRPRLRPDKAVPNSSFNTIRVLSLLSKTKLHDATVARAFTEVCFAARSVVYQRAVQDRRLVIDVGSGRMQSKSVMPFDRCSYILCDPEIGVSTLDRGYTEITAFDSPNIISCIKHAVVSAKPRVYVYRGRLDQLCTPDVLRLVSRLPCSFVCSFSLSYVVPFLAKSLRRYEGLSIHACGFVYDSMKHVDNRPERPVFSVEGIEMFGDIETNSGTFSQPDGTTYREPILMSYMLPRAQHLQSDILDPYPHCRKRLETIFDNFRTWSMC